MTPEKELSGLQKQKAQMVNVALFPRNNVQDSSHRIRS
jgi:hypothetical protein